MLKILGNLPHENIGLALSGGVDSMCIAHFLLQGRKNFTAFYFNHGTKHGEAAERFVTQWCRDHRISLYTSRPSEKYDSHVHNGQQDFFRKERYRFLNFFTFRGYNIILGQHLDDVLETWLFSSFHGTPKLIPHTRGHYIRPFLLTSKEEILNYAHHHGVEWIEDKSNAKLDYMRNRIRHKIVPEVEKINPGIRKTLAKKLIARYNSDK